LPRLVFSPRAEADLEEIGDYIARGNPARAITFLGELRAHCDRFAAAPASYPSREDLAVGVRMAVHGRYLIFFRARSELRADRTGPPPGAAPAGPDVAGCSAQSQLA